MKVLFKFKTFHNQNFNVILPNVLWKIKSLNMKTSGFASLPQKKQRFVVLRSPHIDKKSREHFEVNVFQKILVLFVNLKNPVEKQNLKLLINFIKNSSSGIQMKITYFI